MQKNLESVNPSQDYKILGSVKISTLKEIQDMVTKARMASITWASYSVTKRVEKLEKLYLAFVQNKEKIANLISLEIGMPISYAKDFDMGDGLNYFRWYLDNANNILKDEISHEDENSISRVIKCPIGVACVITPWNFPFSNFVWGVIPHLACGNTVVFKHSEECPLVGKLILEIINSTFPDEKIFFECFGDRKVGEILTSQSVDIISFTGSVKAGGKIYEKASKKFIKVVLELGGSAAAIICENADIDEAVESVFFQRFGNSGQVCDGLKRLLVHENIYEEVVVKLIQKMNSINITDPTSDSSNLGPLVSKKQLAFCMEQVDDAKAKGAKIITPKKLPENLKGAWYPPTLILGANENMRVMNEEVFAPVLPIVKFKNIDEAIKIANSTIYGLGGYVYSKNKPEAQKIANSLVTGMVGINGSNYIIPNNPFGGMKKSGIGREHGKWGMSELVNVKVVTEPKNYNK